MQVRVIKMGFDGLKRRREGEVFDYKGEKLPSWVEPLEDEPRRRPGPAKRQAQVEKADDGGTGEQDVI